MEGWKASGAPKTGEVEVRDGYFRVPLALLCAVVLACAATVLAPPAGRLNWFLEVAPGAAGITVLILTARRFPMSQPQPLRPGGPRGIRGFSRRRHPRGAAAADPA